MFHAGPQAGAAVEDTIVEAQPIVLGLDLKDGQSAGGCLGLARSANQILRTKIVSIMLGWGGGWLFTPHELLFARDSG